MHAVDLDVQRLVARLGLRQRRHLAVEAILLGKEGSQRRDVKGRRDQHQRERHKTQGTQLEGRPAARSGTVGAAVGGARRDARRIAGRSG